MSESTPAPVVAPVVKPDLSEPTVDKAATELATAARPFIPAKVRAAAYTIGGLAIVVAGAIAPVVGGQIGTVIDSVAAAIGAALSGLAVSHVNGK